MTTTTSVTSQSVGTGSNVGYGLFPQKVTIQSTTTAFNLAVQLTNGAASYNKMKALTLYWASSPFSLTAANAVNELRHCARQLDIRPASDAGALTSANTDLDTVLGTYIYFWFDSPAHVTAQTLDCSCVELP